MAQHTTVTEELTRDHREIEELLGRLDGLPAGDPARKERLDQATIALVQHGMAKETHLYPALESHAPDGAELAERGRRDTADVERLLKDAEGHEAGAPEFDRLAGALAEKFRTQRQDEERHLYPALESALGRKRLLELGERVRETKAKAPTRPRPTGPDDPSPNRLLGGGLGFVDRIRDAATGRGGGR